MVVQNLMPVLWGFDMVQKFPKIMKTPKYFLKDQTKRYILYKSHSKLHKVGYLGTSSSPLLFEILQICIKFVHLLRNTGYTWSLPILQLLTGCIHGPRWANFVLHNK